MKPILFNQNIADQNSYLGAYKSEAFVVDPGFNGEAILATLEEKQLTLSLVLITHGHYDHLRDLKLLQQHADFLLVIHEADFPALSDSSLNYAKNFNGSFQVKANQRMVKVKDGEEIFFGAGSIKVLHTPGHTVGGACYLYQNILFSGDTLFCGSVGRTDLAGGSQKIMQESMKKLFTVLSNETLVYPGHDELTTIGAERADNPYVPSQLRK